MKYLIGLIALLSLAVGVLTMTTWGNAPAQRAEAVMVPQATATALAFRARQDEAAAAAYATRAATAVSERVAISPVWQATQFIFLGMAALVIIGLGLAAMARAGVQVQQARQLARLPVTQAIGHGVYLTHRDDEILLIDLFTGGVARLGDEVAVQPIRAGLMDRRLAVERLAQAAEHIAQTTGDASPADWLPHIGDRSPLTLEVNDGPA